MRLVPRGNQLLHLLVGILVIFAIIWIVGGMAVVWYAAINGRYSDEVNNAWIATFVGTFFAWAVSAIAVFIAADGGVFRD